ncbi:hypothetical protein V6N11_038323 [Hibiscus sabdariffa]|uniref:Protein kinase domain-containing protein n=1 Tax=Hibiscus sabdariffa TaxID=183260 RepID=A0ABR2SJL0_9ROSI
MGSCGHFPCFESSNKEESNSGGSIKELRKKDSAKYGSVGQSHHINGDSLENFRPECLLGEGGFGRVLVYKGRLERTGQVCYGLETNANLCLLQSWDLSDVKYAHVQVVAVKRLDGNGLQGNRGFLAELLILNLLHHPNLVKLIGYCADGDRRLLVFKFMPLGSLEDHLHSKGCPSFGFHDTCSLALVSIAPSESLASVVSNQYGIFGGPE